MTRTGHWTLNSGHRILRPASMRQEPPFNDVGHDVIAIIMPAHIQVHHSYVYECKDKGLRPRVTGKGAGVRRGDGNHGRQDCPWQRSPDNARSSRPETSYVLTWL